MDIHSLFFLTNEYQRDGKIVEEFWNENLIVIGAIALLIPGFITDSIGGFLLIPITRKLITVSINKFT